MFFHSVPDLIAVVLGEAIPGHVGGVAGDASNASALEHRSGTAGSGSEVVEAEPAALAVTSAADFAVGANYHGVDGRRFEVFEGVGDGSAVDCGIIIFWININTCGYIDEVVHVAVDAELPSGLGTCFGPRKNNLVGGGSTNIGVGGSRAGDSGGEVDFIAPAAEVACATDGTHFHGIAGFRIEITKGVHTGVEVSNGNVDKVVHVVVHANLPCFGSAVLGPAQVNATSTGSLIIEVGGFGTGLCADGVEHCAITVAVTIAGEKRIASFGKGPIMFAIPVITCIINKLEIVVTEFEGSTI